jgi:hypothetical protein
MCLVAVEGIEPTSLDYRSSALAIELHREVIADCRLPIAHCRSDFEPSTFDTIKNRQSAIGNELVDPTGLKPAPHGLKGRCSVTRAPDQDIDDF